MKGPVLVATHVSFESSPVIELNFRTAEQIAAGIRGGKRQYNGLVQGAGASFFLDFWRIAIKEFEKGTPENIDWIVGNLKGLDSPHFS